MVWKDWLGLGIVRLGFWVGELFLLLLVHPLSFLLLGSFLLALPLWNTRSGLGSTSFHVNSEQEVGTHDGTGAGLTGSEACVLHCHHPCPSPSLVSFYGAWFVSLSCPLALFMMLLPTTARGWRP